MIEFAAYMVIFIVMGRVYVPDYALFYTDCHTDFADLYGSEEQLETMKIQRKKSSTNKKDSVESPTKGNDWSKHEKK